MENKQVVLLELSSWYKRKNGRQLKVLHNTPGRPGGSVPPRVVTCMNRLKRLKFHSSSLKASEHKYATSDYYINLLHPYSI